MTFSIPEPLKLEHSELHEELAQATKAGGQVGEAAKAVARVLHGHFVDEEAFALPPLGVLAQMARGEIVADARQVVALTERLKSELPRMLSEHDAIVAAVQALIAAAQAESRPEFVRFAEKLMLHARTEEEVLYPAAILVGEHLKHTSGTRAPAAAG
jgi:hypothetical protein